MFPVKEALKKDVLVLFFKSDINGFVWFGVYGEGGPYLGDESSNSFCWHVSDAFEGFDDTTLTGKDGDWDEGPYHHCTRLVAIQLV